MIYPGHRRVSGLRREEVADLAGISVSYYTSLEQGRACNVSPQVLAALAKALGLDNYQETHLRELAALPHRSRHNKLRRSVEQLDANLRSLLDALQGTPALISGRTGNVLAWNAMRHALFAPHLDADAPKDRRNRPNTARLVFLDDRNRDFFINWEENPLRSSPTCD